VSKISKYSVKATENVTQAKISACSLFHARPSSPTHSHFETYRPILRVVMSKSGQQATHTECSKALATCHTLST
jgi:hypothetical protein